MQIKVNNVEKQIYLTPTLRKTENIYSEDYFQYNDFAALRKKFLTPITDACISSTFSEIRDLISTIKDLTPSPLPPSPPSLYFKKIEKNIKPNEEDLKRRSGRDSNLNYYEENSFYNNVEGLKEFLRENLKETKELKEMLSTNDRNFKSERKDARISKKSEQGGWNTEVKQTGIKLEINEAEKKVFEMQTQRLLNKIENLNSKYKESTEKCTEQSKKVNQFEEMFLRPKIVGKIGWIIDLNKESISKLSLADVTGRLEFEDIYIFFEKEQLDFCESWAPRKLRKRLLFSDLVKITIFTKDDNQLLGHYVIKYKEGEAIQYIFIKLKDVQSTEMIECFILGLNLACFFKKHSNLNLNLAVNKLAKPSDLSQFFDKLANKPKGKAKLVNSNSMNLENNKIIPLKIPLQKNSLLHFNSPTRGKGYISPSSKTPCSMRTIKEEGRHKKTRSNDMESQLTFKSLTYPLKLRKDVEDLYDNFLKAEKVMLNGFLFLKYGKYGDPHERFIYLSNCKTKLEWRAINKKVGEFVEIEHIKEIMEGRESPNFKRFKQKNNEQMELSFSVICISRNLDLEANTLDNKRKFIISLKYLIDRFKLESSNKQRELPLRSLITQEFLNKESIIQQ